MKKAIRATVLALAISAMVVSAVPTTANAYHKVGHVAAAFGLGLLLGGGIAANAQQGGYIVQQQPVYVQPRICYRQEKYFDPYAGWVYRQVQYYC